MLQNLVNIRLALLETQCVDRQHHLYNSIQDIKRWSHYVQLRWNSHSWTEVLEQIQKQLDSIPMDPT